MSILCSHTVSFEKFRIWEILNFYPWNHKVTVSVGWAMTQISLGIHPDWSVFTVHSVGNYRSKFSLCGEWDSADLDQTELTPRLIWDSYDALYWFSHVVAHLWPFNSIALGMTKTLWSYGQGSHNLWKSWKTWKITKKKFHACKNHGI